MDSISRTPRSRRFGTYEKREPINPPSNTTEVTLSFLQQHFTYGRTNVPSLLIPFRRTTQKLASYGAHST